MALTEMVLDVGTLPDLLVEAAPIGSCHIIQHQVPLCSSSQALPCQDNRCF